YTPPVEALFFAISAGFIAREANENAAPATFGGRTARRECSAAAGAAAGLAGPFANRTGFSRRQRSAPLTLGTE
ncbi:MAG: hypothetical protein U1A07_25015, partial [Phenylobacterium sp.]|nr:hypothetical protein [Phenylobacterium sp.]